MTSHLRFLPVVWVVGLLALPCYPLGIRRAAAERLEDAAKAASPSISVDSLRHAVRRYAKLDDFFLDGLPLRDRALELYGNIEVGLFHETTRIPSPRTRPPRLAVLHARAGDVRTPDQGWPLVDPYLAADSVETPGSDSGRLRPQYDRRLRRLGRFLTHPADAPV